MIDITISEFTTDSLVFDVSGTAESSHNFIAGIVIFGENDNNSWLNSEFDYNPTSFGTIDGNPSYRINGTIDRGNDDGLFAFFTGLSTVDVGDSFNLSISINEVGAFSPENIDLANFGIHSYSGNGAEPISPASFFTEGATLVPEPSSAALLGMLVLTVAVLRRRFV